MNTVLQVILNLLLVNCLFGQEVINGKQYETNTVVQTYHKGKKVDLKFYIWNVVSLSLDGDVFVNYFLVNGEKVQDHGKILKKTVYNDLNIKGTIVKCSEFLVQFVSGDTRKYIIGLKEGTGDLAYVMYMSDYNPVTREFDSMSFWLKE